MSEESLPYYDDVGNEATKLGRKIYDEALAGRRGFRTDQIGIDPEDDVWLEIFENIGDVALKVIKND